ncbi:phosphatase PAP2 family protein [uncultured Maribacter sp.]|uniref:phosphatase PAP2 family protein n=1 Tax=uncultured Maribacter sp. TaxID=431308 RepID=UPI002607F27C|nr:phosphatase PAP2 family protein [uncultured Maribacter sp.]
MLEELVQLDKAIFLYLNNLGVSTWDSFWLFVTNKLSSIPLYVVLLFFSYKQLGVKKTLLLLFAVVVMIGVTDQLANFFKYGVQRLRPCHDGEINTLMRLVKSYCGGKYGYFSAHAANSFAVAIFFTNVLKTKCKYLALFLFTWAALVAYSRVYIGVHFPLDILTGTGIGLFLGWLFTKLYIFALQKFPI